ncbi:hypothetical protein P3T39_006471 [Kitasatospora sp. GP82]|nr:hypothetical protein [Kitasatospora sp. GP82]
MSKVELYAAIRRDHLASRLTGESAPTWRGA